MNMKKIHSIQKIIVAVLLSFIIAAFVIPAGAAFAYGGNQLWDSYDMPSTRQKDRLYDQAGLLTPSEQADILAKLDSVSEKHQCNVVILTVDDHTGPIQDFADDYFDYNGFQADYDSDGILFMLSMYDREYAFSTCGRAIQAFTDYGQDAMFNEMAGYLSQNDYYSAFDRYVSLCDELLRLEEEGTPYDVHSEARIEEPKNYAKAALICVVIGLGFAFIPVGIMASALTSVHKNETASGYQSHDGLKLTLHQDTYIRSSTSRTAIPKNDDSRSGSGGSSIHISSSGSSHGGSHGHF